MSGARERPPFRFAHRLEVRFRDCDPMGHVNNAVYLTYLEAARFAYWKEALGYEAGTGPGFIMARAECDFRAQARPGDCLDVWIRVSELGRSSYWFDYEIVRSAGDLVMLAARTVQVVFDYEAQRPQPIPEDLRTRIERFEATRPTAAPAGARRS